MKNTSVANGISRSRSALCRHRSSYAVLIVLLMLLGLITRRYGGVLGVPWLAKTLRDGLWALCVYGIFGFARPSVSLRAAAVGALLLSFVIEFSELWHAGWIDALRRYWLGALILGVTFHWVNFLNYALGIGVGVLSEWWWYYRRPRSVEESSSTSVWK